jgi:formamidopyrimidine-DNA glycosylase
MPELPEVEMYRRYLNETSMEQQVKHVEILHPKVAGGQEQNLMELTGDWFTKSRRWGKNIFVETRKGQTMFMHFGMTGYLEYYNSSMEHPNYSRVVFEFDNGFNLAYVSKRMFGRIGVTSSIEDHIVAKSLGADALEIDREQFVTRLAGKKKNIKTALLDQSVTAGVGNWIADEILYHTRIHPTSPAGNMSPRQLDDIYEKMREIMQVAIDVEAVREELPLHYITRYGRKKAIECPNCKRVIERTEVGGRGTYACENCQVVY